MLVDILDVGSGNIGSVKNWVDRLEVSSRVVSQPDELSAELLILPGVGAIGSFMDRLRDRGFDEAIKHHVAVGNRLVGICLGLQAMMRYSEEDGTTVGLGLLDGYVERLINDTSNNAWHAANIDYDAIFAAGFSRKQNLSRKKYVRGRAFYNHEYGVIADGVGYTLPISSELKQYSGLVVKENVLGVQFHPEKSQSFGMNFLGLLL